MVATINQTNKVLLQVKRIHICGVYLGHLPQTSLGGLHVLSSISISTCSGEAFASRWPWSLSLSLSLPLPLLLCLHIQFSWDMCTYYVFFFSDWYGIYACIFNSRRICAKVLYFLLRLVWDMCLHIQFPENMCISGLSVLTYEEVLVERFNG